MLLRNGMKDGFLVVSRRNCKEAVIRAFVVWSVCPWRLLMLAFPPFIVRVKTTCWPLVIFPATLAFGLWPLVFGDLSRDTYFWPLVFGGLSCDTST